jgi:hypothetical protein
VPLIPSAKNSGVVKARVTSTKERPGEEPGMLRLRNPPVPRGAEAQTNHAGRWFPPEKIRAQPEVLCYRDAGMARRRVTSSVTRCGAEAPQLCSTIPPGEDWWDRAGPSGLGLNKPRPYTGPQNLPARIADRRRFAPWQRAQTEVCATEEEVGRGVGRGYFASNAGDCGFESHLAQEKAGGLKAAARRASSSTDRAPNVPD